MYFLYHFIVLPLIFWVYFIDHRHQQLVYFYDLCTALHTIGPTLCKNIFVLLGDFNVNYFCKNFFLYQHLQSSLGSLIQIVKEATHTSPNGMQSLIHLVFVSHTSYCK